MSIDEALRAALEAAVMANQEAWAAPRSESASGCPNLACGLDCRDCNGTGMIWDQDMIADHAAEMTIAAFRKALDERGLRVTAIDLNANDEFAAGWRNGMRLGRRLALTGHQGALGGNPLRVTSVDPQFSATCCACGDEFVSNTFDDLLCPDCGSYRNRMPLEAPQEAQDEQLMLEATEIPYKRPSPTAEPENADLGAKIARAIARSKP